ncbi:MAG: exo-alpha-sialidase [Opitutaceae bacterium]|nr:exo-alpha-sialidase [Opitutaceae bacterium]
MRILLVCFALFGLASAALAQNPPEKPKPDSRFGNWLFKAPDPQTWQRSEQNGALTFSVPRPPGDFCVITLFPGGPAGADFAAQFEAAVAADQKARGTVTIEADSGAKPSKSQDGFDVLTRNLRSETDALHTLHIYFAGRSGNRFDLVAFQTSSERSWQQFGPQAAKFVQSLRLASALPPGEADKLLGIAPPAVAVAKAPPPSLPGFDDVLVPALAPPAPAPAAAIPPTVEARPLAPVNVPLVPLDQSPVVVNGAVGQKNGKPVDGLKLSQHDTEIGSPSIVAAPDGSIHIAFVEKHRTTYAMAVYHRSSADSGKTWTEAKNLSEDLPGIAAGRCIVIADARGRVYVLWRSGLREYSTANVDPWGGTAHSNLVYRVLEGGKWSRIKPVHPPGSPEKQNDGALSFFATTDAAGRAQVLWNTSPNKWHPELTVVSGTYVQTVAGVGNGLVFQATLDGVTASEPREVFLPEVAGKSYDIHCDGLDTINGYVDSAGAAHFVALVTRNYDSSLSGKSRYQLIEGGKAGAFIDLPEMSYHAWRNIPTLLVDAAGRRHLVTLYPAGERPNVRDYLIGSEDEPVVIRAAAAVKGTVGGFQAFQGPGGRMLAIMQMNDTGDRASGDTFISMSTGEGWSTPVNVTNNAGRKKFASTQTSAASNIAVSTSYYPGPAAATFDREGRVLLLMINNEYGLFGSSAFGVSLGGGSSSTPTLQFLRF